MSDRRSSWFFWLDLVFGYALVVWAFVLGCFLGDHDAAMLMLGLSIALSALSLRVGAD